jgi:FkbM family methyltransferase
MMNSDFVSLSPATADRRLGPIIIMAFNRPDYLKRTALSLAAQPSIADGRREVHLFQDGAVNFHSKERYAEDEVIEASVAAFRAVFPTGLVHLSKANIGVALNYERAERYVFLERAFPSAMFFEDDMVLGQHYIDSLQMMLDYAASPESQGLVGYVAAYGEHRSSLAEQKARKREITAMGHAWGYGVNREHWLRTREVIDPYIQIVSDCDYRKRPKAAIGGVHKQLGLATRSLSQDAMKTLATAWLGRVRLMPFVCQALYVGESGLNYTPEAYAKQGYGREQLFQDRLGEMDWPSEKRLRDMVEADRAGFAKTCQEAYGTRQMPLPPKGTFNALDYLGGLNAKNSAAQQPDNVHPVQPENLTRVNSAPASQAAQSKESGMSTTPLPSPFGDIRRLLPEQSFDVIIDVGANVGQSTLKYASAFPNAKILAFEPTIHSFKEITKATEHMPGVKTVQMALGRSSGTVRMIMHKTATRNRVTDAPLQGHVQEVEMMRLDEYLAKEGITSVNFLKIDTEGFDLDVLAGATGALPHIDFVQVEVSMNRYNRFHVSFAEVEQFMSENGFMLFYLYGQSMEGKGYPVLRRADPVFISSRLVGKMEGIIIKQ